MTQKDTSAETKNLDWRKVKRPISVNALKAPDDGSIKSVEQVLKTAYCSQSKRIELSWEELGEMLLTPIKAPKPSTKLAQLIDKASHNWWSPSVFAPSRRLGKNCEQVSWAVLDVDDNCPPLDMLRRRMYGARLEGYILPSYSATSGKPKARIVIAIDEPLVMDGSLADLKKQQNALNQALAEMLGVKADPSAACDVARLFWASIDNGENMFSQAVPVKGMIAPTDLLVALGQKRISYQGTLEAWGTIGDGVKVNANGNVDVHCLFYEGHSEPPKVGDAFINPEGHYTCNHTSCSKGVIAGHEYSGRGTRGYIIRMVVAGEHPIESVVEELTDSEKFAQGELIGINAHAKRIIGQHRAKVRFNTFTRRREVTVEGAPWDKSWDAFVAQVQQLWPRSEKKRAGEGIAFSALDKALRVVAEYDAYDPRLEWLKRLE